MKKFLLLLALFVGLNASAALKTTVFNADVHCQNCVNRVLNNVPSLGKGIEDVKVDLASRQIEVVYDDAVNSDENIIKGLSGISVKAEVAQGEVAPMCDKKQHCDKKEGGCDKQAPKHCDKKEGGCDKQAPKHCDKKEGGCDKQAPKRCDKKEGGCDKQTPKHCDKKEGGCDKQAPKHCDKKEGGCDKQAPKHCDKKEGGCDKQAPKHCDKKEGGCDKAEGCEQQSGKHCGKCEH